jgi:predicted amidohydrolase YtcJ
MNLLKNRRSFLESVGFTAATVGSGWASFAQAAENKAAPDLIVINAKVTTMDPAQPRAEGFAVLKDRFLAVGSTTEMKALAGPKTRVYDAKGMMVTPAFADTHNHGGGEQLLFGVVAGDPYGCEFTTIKAIQDKLRKKAATLPPGTWVNAIQYDLTKVKDNRQITRQDLDAVSTDHPIEIMHRGSHSWFYNSKAFEMAGITKNTPNPVGGTYDKDTRGELNGRVTDTARRAMVKPGIGKYETFTPAEKARRELAGVEFISKKYTEQGLVSVCHNESVLDAMQTARGKGTLLHRVSYEVNGDLLEAMIKNNIRTGFGDETLSFGATTEHTADGAISSRTAAISRPYIGITPVYKGNLVLTAEEIEPWAERVHRAGIRVNTHSNGDVSIDQTLTAYEKVFRKFPRPNIRPRITHCSVMNESLIRRAKALDVCPSEFSTYLYYNADKFAAFGAEFMKYTMPYRSLIDAGIKVSTGSDFGAGPYQPLMAIQGMVTRKGFNGETWGINQKVTVDEAIRCGTLFGAYATGEENIKGSITAGKLADYVVFSDDLHAIDPEKILGVKVVQTVVGGVVRHQA